MIKQFTLEKEDYNSLLFGDSTEMFEVVDEGSWESEGKWESKQVVFKDIESGQHFIIEGTRSGSYYSDYYYEDDYEAVAVEPVEKVVVIWQPLL